MRRAIAMLIAASLCLPVLATGDGHRGHKPKVVVIRESRDGEVIAALIGAGITYWIVHRRQKRRTVREHDSCFVTEDQGAVTEEIRVERALRECIK